MAINPETKYPTQTTASTPEYPYGAARNITVPGDGKGTPWEKDIINDIFGWQQDLLSSAGITPSGSPDKVGASQYVDATNLLSIARSLNVADSAVISSNDTVTVLDNVQYIHDATAQTTWSKPAGVGAGETITDVTGSALTTTGGNYTLISAFEPKEVWAEMFGFSTSNSGAANAISLQYAMDYLAPNPSSSAYAAPTALKPGGIVRIGAGKFDITSVERRSFVKIQGSGIGGTLLNPVGTSGYVIDVSALTGGDGVVADGVSGMTIGSQSNYIASSTARPTVGGINYSRGRSGGELSDLYINNLFNTGLNLTNTFDMEVQNVTVFYCGVGLVVDSDADEVTNAVKFLSLRIESCETLLIENNTSGLAGSQVRQNQYISCKFELNIVHPIDGVARTDSGMIFGGTANPSLSNCMFVPTDATYPLIKVDGSISASDNRGMVISGGTIAVGAGYVYKFIDAVNSGSGVVVTGMSGYGLGEDALSGDVYVDSCNFYDCKAPVLNIASGTPLGKNIFNSLNTSSYQAAVREGGGKQLSSGGVSSGVTYQNTEGSILMLTFEFEFPLDGTSSNTEIALGATAGALQIQQRPTFNTTPNTGGYYRTASTLLVPPGWFYKATWAGGAALNSVRKLPI